MRDRLIELICEGMAYRCGAECRTPHKQYCKQCFEIADYLIAKGVIVPPCKVGDTLYMIVEKRARVTREYFRFIKTTKLSFYNIERVVRDFGKTVFLTKEEAEQALKGGVE